MPSPPAPLSISQVLGPGRLLVLTDRTQAQGDLLGVIKAAVAGGATAILLREKDIPRPERAELAKAILAQLHEPAHEDRPWPSGTPPRSCRALHRAGDAVAPRDFRPGLTSCRSLRAPTGLLVASDVELAVEVGAVGVHLAASDPWPTGALDGADGQRLLVGRSCHTEQEVVAAREAGADYVTVSPVFATESKPGYGPSLGVDGLAGLCQAAHELPVLALGGIRPGRVAPCLAAGAAGVAVMGEVMRAGDPATAVSSLLRETGT